MRTWGRAVRAACAAAFVVVMLAPGAAQAATPTVENQATVTNGGVAQTTWLASMATGGQDDKGANVLRIEMLVKHDPGRKVTGLRIDDDWDGSDESSSAAIKTLSGSQSQQPTIQNGLDYTRISYSYSIPTSNTGMSCTSIFGGTRRTDDRVVRVRARLDNGTETAVTASRVKFVANGQCLGAEDYAFIYSWGASNFGQTVVPGTTKTFTYTGDDPDTTGDSDFQGINYRVRNLRTGAISQAAQVSCPGNGDNASKSVDVSFPNRGAYIVEAELRDGSGCSQDQNPGYWFAIGTVNVNAGTMPAPGISATRPQIGGNTTVTVTPPTDPDSGAGGRTEYIEWDLDGNTTNGVGGYEQTTLGDAVSGITTAQTKTISTAGQTPGLHVVRARVTDNGAMAAADNARETSGVATTTYLVDTPPVAQAQSVSTESGVSKPITLTATDADADPLTYSIVSGPAHGTLTGSGPNRTYTPAATYAGPDSFVFQAADGFGGTHTATISIRVDPQTAIDSAPAPFVATRSASFTFSSPVAGAAFECSIDDAAFSACTSPASYSDLADGEHLFRVRAVAAGNTDPTPAQASWTVDLADPDTSIVSGPPDPSNTASPTFTFSATEPVSGYRCSLDGAAFAACPNPYGLSGLGEGQHTLAVAAVDRAGNVDPSPATQTWTVDLTAPETNIDSAPAPLDPSPAPTFTFSSPDPTATFECRLDNTTYKPCASPYTLPVLNNGPHVLEVRAVDPAQNRDATPATHAWTIKSSAPETLLDSGPPNPDNSSSPQFTFSSDDPAASFECRLDGGTFAACTTPATLSGVGEGEHTFEVRAYDGAGNRDPSPAEHTWTVDLTQPDTTIDSGPVGSTSSTQPTFTFSSADAGATFECRFDTEAFAPCSSPYTAPALSDGPHTFEVHAIDAAGNRDAAGATRSFVVDTASPATSLDSAPSGLTSSRSASVEFSSPDPDAGFRCRLDAGDWEECESAQLYGDLADGAHTIAVKAVDSAGNEDPNPPSATWTVDGTAPETAIDDGPAGVLTTGAATLQFSSADGGATFECRVDDAAFASCASPLELTGLGDGQHVFRVRAIDEAGNADTTPAARSWRIDRAGPTVTILSGPGSPTRSSSAALEFTADEEVTGFACRIDGGSFAPCTSPYTASGLADGAHLFEVKATDAAGNPGSATSRGWTVDSAAPVVTITSGPPATTDQTTAAFTFAADEVPAAFECSLDGGAFVSCSSPRTFTGLDEGDHSAAIRAVDPAGNIGEAKSQDWTVRGSDAPETTIGSRPAGVSSSTSATFAFSSSNPAATFECRLDGGAFTACAAPKTYTALAAGSHDFAVRARDAGGRVDPTPATAGWTVSPPASPQVSPPVITFAKGALKVPAGGRVRVATVSCPSACLLTAKSAKLRIAGKKRPVGISAPGTLAAGATRKVFLTLPAASLKALAEAGRGKATVHLTFTPTGGSARTASKALSLRPGKRR